MRLHPTPFLADTTCASIDKAEVVVLPLPYEGGVSYGHGAARGPDAILEASSQVEFYDALLRMDARSIGIVTAEAPDTSQWETPEEMDRQVRTLVSELAKRGKFVVALGGDHSVSPGCVFAQAQRHKQLGVVQFDAHADLRDSYSDSPNSHACAMARIREITTDTVQLGIRSMCAEEADEIERNNLNVLSIQDLRADPSAAQRHIASLPSDVYVTIDVDVFDGGVVWSTGTPEPGGMLWYETVGLLNDIFTAKNVVGVDVVELAPRDGDINSPYSVAKLVYHLICLHARNARS